VIDSARVGLVSVDYEKFVRWDGRGAVPKVAKQVLAAAHESARSLAVSLRMHHVPLNAAIYKWLMSEGVTLIGASDLKRSRTILEPLLP
jgi:hypothetical protein